MMKNIEQLCQYYGLGKLQKEPEPVSGGLLHKMYRVITEQGTYAVKQLNPDIMKRPTALSNFINSEVIANAFRGVVPLVAAKSFGGKHILEWDGSFYIIYDWLDGKSVFSPDISVRHCKQIGEALGKIHSADLTIAGLEREQKSRVQYDWMGLLLAGEKAENDTTYEICCTLLRENLADLIRWDQNVVAALPELAQCQVISHRDLDPKNVMWQQDRMYVIDWEAAGYVNPWQELIEVLNYWICDPDGSYNKVKCQVLLGAYAEYIDLKKVQWEPVLAGSYDGMLGWLEYNIKRALGMEGTAAEDRREGMQQMCETMAELKKYEKQMSLLQLWLSEFVNG